MQNLISQIKRYVYLKDLGHIDTPVTATTIQYGRDKISQARQNLIAANLRWDNSTGKIYEGRECVERFSNASDHKPHHCEEDVMRWEFSRYIANEAFKLTRV